MDIIEPFDVAFWLGDPTAPLDSGKLLDTQVMAGLPNNSSQKFAFTWTAPAEVGSLVLTVVADNNHAVTEAIETNNYRR